MDPELKRYRIEQAEGYLSSIKKLYRKIRELNAEVEAQREIVSGVTGIDYTKGYTRGSASSDKIPDGVSKLLETISEAVEAINEYVALQEEAVRTLDEMGGLGAKVLKLRYVFPQPWRQIGVILNYSPGYLKRVAKKALCVYYSHMPAKYRDPMHPAI